MPCLLPEVTTKIGLAIELRNQCWEVVELVDKLLLAGNIASPEGLASPEALSVERTASKIYLALTPADGLIPVVSK